MSNDSKKMPPGADGDPQEAQALQDLLNTSAPAANGPVDSSVFEQDLFGSAPPPPKPAAPRPAAPKPAPPKPKTAPPPPPPPPAAEEEDVKIITPDDFDKLTSPISEPPGLSVEGASAYEGAVEEWDDEESAPELVSSVEAVPYEEPAPQAESTADEWELDSPEDESAPIDEVLGAAAKTADDIAMKPEGTPVTLKAAKAKEGAQAIEEARELIEKLDGLEEGFLDVAEVKKGMKMLADLVNRVEELAARIEALEARLK